MLSKRHTYIHYMQQPVTRLRIINTPPHRATDLPIDDELILHPPTCVCVRARK